MVGTRPRHDERQPFYETQISEHLSVIRAVIIMQEKGWGMHHFSSMHIFKPVAEKQGGGNQIFYAFAGADNTPLGSDGTAYIGDQDRKAYVNPTLPGEAAKNVTACPND